MVRKIIKEILDQVPEEIMRLHKSYAVNINKIDAINSTFVLINETEIPLGKAYRDEIMKGVNSL
jgi:DNA-binding LytR/AlgR family response regulator